MMKNKPGSDFESIARRRLFLVLFVLLLSTLLFYFLQNAAFLVGGGIAIAKLVWLSYVILFWYLIPLLIVFDKRVTRPYYLAFVLFIINMSLRAIVELWMIYFTLGWHPYYGIAHDIFSAVVVASIYIILHRKTYLDGVLSKYLLVLLFMFVAECFFAEYLLSVMWKSSEAIYFVPENNDHVFILNMTWAVVVLLTIYFILFSRRWLNGPIKT